MELLPGLAGHLVEGKTATAPALTLSELDTVLAAFIVGDYNQRPHSQIDEAPHTARLGKGWLPRMPDSLDDLDLLLMTAAKARAVQRDGIHFQGTRYIDTTLAAYVGESVTIRFDPRDVSEIRIFHHNRFLCRAVSPEYADRTVTLKDIETARKAFRRSLRSQIRERVARVLLIGMSGMEKRLSHFSQFYSRAGFAHNYRPLTGDELTFVLTRHWRSLGINLDDADFTDVQAVATIARITCGNFRLLHRLFTQIERIMKINEMTVITDDVVEAARSTGFEWQANRKTR